MPFTRLTDLISLILSQAVTFLGMVDYKSIHAVVHKNNPARWMLWSDRKRLLNPFNGGFLLDGKVGRVSRRTTYRSIITAGGMGTFRFLLSLFYTELCSALLKERKGRLPVLLLLEEFAHLRIPGFPTFAATARKYRVGFWLILQSLSQLAANYGQEDARAILESVGTESYFGGMGLDTAQNLSARPGMAFRLNWLDPSAGLQQRPLMRPDELIRLRDNELLILYGNRDPLRIRTLPFYRRWDLRRRARMPPPPEVLDVRDRPLPGGFRYRPLPTSARRPGLRSGSR